MAITDTIASIREYFDSWHGDDTHSRIKTTTVSNNDNTKMPTSKAVYDAIQNAKTSILNNLSASTIRTSQAQVSIQNVLDDLTSEIKNKINKTEYAKAEYNEWSYGTDGRGANIEVKGEKVNGLMTWKDKAFLKELGTWHQVNGKGVGTHMEVWVNFPLRLVYFSFSEEGCKKLQNTKKYKYALTTPSQSVWYRFRPLHGTYTATSDPDVIMGVTSGGTFYLKSTKVHESTDISGSIVWFFRDGDGKNYNHSAHTPNESDTALSIYNKFTYGSD